MQEDWNDNTHRQNFFALALTIFAMVGAVHLMRFFYQWEIVVEGVVIPQSLSLIAVFVMLSMIALVSYYLFADK